MKQCKQKQNKKNSLCPKLINYAGNACIHKRNTNAVEKIQMKGKCILSERTSYSLDCFLHVPKKIQKYFLKAKAKVKEKLALAIMIAVVKLRWIWYVDVISLLLHTLPCMCFNLFNKFYHPKVSQNNSISKIQN